MPTPPPPDIPTHVDPAARATLLRRAYEGEIIGCAMYEQMITNPWYPNTEALQLLYDIERITADALKPLVVRYAVPVTEDDAEREGQRIADTLAGQPWKSMWTEVIRLADDYLTDFKRLAAVLEGDDATVGRQVVEHEEALIEFAHREINEADDALVPLQDYRRRYAS